MTTKQAARNELARIGDTRYRVNQAAGEGLVIRRERPTWRENALEKSRLADEDAALLALLAA